MSNRYPKYEKYGTKKKEEKGSVYERFINLIRSIQRVLKTANKPGRSEYMMTFKIVIIGLLILGALSYVIQLILTIIPL
ncbi:MAG: hypothetical protein BAJALOKI3v1_770022 [Promethearchaeota archaeon]|jgi:protein translocase SEC61 complex gamma subunit|nr:MAG: hypothetical protein BAJALOKI3v1_770022 [Candidatus Lokiarchaeota archaeon]